MGTRAFSHDSIFIPDGEAEDEQDIQTLSQECIGGKVRSLQQQIAKNIRFGQPPPNISGKRMQDMDVSAEEMDDTQVSPAEIIGRQDTILQENTNLTSRSPEANVPETERKAEDKVTPIKMSRHKHHQASSGTIESINLDAVPRSVAPLDNSAAKHKLAVKPKNQRVSQKHRRMSQCFEDTEYKEETVFTMVNSPNKENNYHKEKPLLDINLPDRPDQKNPEDRTPGMGRTLTENLDRTLEERKKSEDVKPLEDDRNVRLKSQQEEEERKRKELEKVIWILEQQKENELKEQRRREEERKKRAEQCLKELEEHRKREEQKRELEEQIARQKAENRLQEKHKGKPQNIEEQNKPELQSHEMWEKETMPETDVKKKQKVVCFSETAMSVVEDQKMSEEPKPVEQESAQTQQRQIGAEEQERRWQEVEQGQKPFTFKVSSGEKQIIFDKVNLVPVSPSKGPSTHPGTHGEKRSLGSHALPSNQYVPHTAILVTGAQLCDPAENTIQIKNTACKSLLGLTEDKKQPQNLPIKNETQDTKQISVKTHYTSESQENQAVFTELTSMQKKILSRSEIISISDRDRGGSRICSDDWTDKEKGDSHSHLRKTMSASPRFSITPAWQKFAESVSSTEINTDKKSKENVATMKNIFSENEAPKNTENIHEIVPYKIKKQVTIDSKTESYYFSKDLPSFLVPNPPQSPRKLHVGNENSSENQMSSSTAQKTDKLAQNGEETISPFGIILRRTNYSLRFHGDPQNEQKKKKRYSAGDSFEGVSGSFMASGKIEIESHGCRRTMSTSSTTKETVKVLLDTSNNPDDDIHPTSVPLIPVSTNNVVSPNKETTVPRPPVVQKPSVALKPSSPTPSVSSPQSTLNRANVIDPSSHLYDKQTKEVTAVNIKVNTVVSTLSVNNKEETEPKDKKYSFPSISIPWRDKSEKKTDHIGKEKPVLQSRHSIDSRLMEKVETAQPLWIMLALQKQKGFREQHAHREERRHAREAKQADKLAKENAPSIQPGEYRGRSGSLQKMAAPEDKPVETVKTRLQRREQLQKSNTLPTSATVDITENIPGTAQTRDNQKRFSTPNATAMSPEPDWMALAKRKSMAWKDSPQIIK
uniref:Capping protein inhibiting regulator of actin dynamics n=1 Tax=Leptobrachium leishanense TaxID=445787 RepID=A0A8C5P8Z2_9ANUR